MKKELIITADGSHSIYLKEMNEQYHSIHGALAEAQHIYINSALREKMKTTSEVKIFEVGFGTGLNALLTLKFAVESNNHVEYHTIEKYPLSMDIITQLNYGYELNLQTELGQLHYADWDQRLSLNEYFSLYKIEADLMEWKSEQGYDLIYFDAFAPEKQAAMWSEEILSNMYDSLKQGGILITYCVKGEIRRRLKGLGFEIEKLKGPESGKREILRAEKV